MHLIHAIASQPLSCLSAHVLPQLFYDVDIFIKFVADCRSVGITVPIIPGALLLCLCFASCVMLAAGLHG